MTRPVLSLAAALLLAAPLAAQAEGWTTEDLGDSATEQACVEKATRMFDKFGEYYSHHSTSAQTWTVAGYDLTHDDFDGLVACAYGPDGKTRATLVVYSAGAAPDDKRAEIAATLKGIWNEL